MLVHRVLVVLVELQQAPRVSERGDDFFQHAHVVQPAQRFAEPQRVGQHLQELLHDRGFGSLGYCGAVRYTKCHVSCEIRLPSRRARSTSVSTSSTCWAKPRDGSRRRADLVPADLVVALGPSPQHRLQHAAHPRRRLHQLAQPMRHPPHVRRVVKIVAHEPFHRLLALAALVLERLGHAKLLGAAQGIARLVRVKVHLVASTQQKVLRRHQPPMIELPQHAHVVQPVGIGHARS